MRAEAIPPMAGSDEVMARIDRRPGVVYSALVPNPKGAELALQAKADELELVVSASETHNRKNVRRSVAESLVGARELVELAHGEDVPVEAIVSTAFGCPYEGDVAPERVAQLAGHLLDAGADRLSFGDTTGMATPRRVARSPRRARARRYRALTASASTSTTRAAPRSRTSSPASSAASRGSTRRSAGSAAVRTRPARRATRVTEDLVHMLEDMGIETGIDLDALLDCARLAQEIVGRELPSALLHAGPRTRHYESTS